MSTPTASEPETKPVRVRRTIIISHEYEVTPGVLAYLGEPPIEKVMDLDRSYILDETAAAVRDIVEGGDDYSLDVKMEALP